MKIRTKHICYGLIAMGALMFLLGVVSEMNRVEVLAARASETTQRVADAETKLELLNDKIFQLVEELARARVDNATLSNLNSQFIRENIRLKRQLILERRARRRMEQEKKGE